MIQYFMSVLNFLKGKKTYILAILGALYALEQFVGGDITLSTLIAGLLGSGSLASMRAAVAKV